MRQLLVVANIAHAFTRVFPLGTYLPEFGWAVTVLTPPVPLHLLNRLHPPGGFREATRIVEVPFAGDVFRFWRRTLLAAGFAPEESLTEQIKARARLGRLASVADEVLKWYQSIFAFPDTERSWRDPAVRAGTALLAAQRFDALMSSSPLPTCHIAAAALKRRFNLPWVADFRDPWTRNHNYPYGPLRRHVEERLERRVLEAADAMTAASPGYARKQQELHGRSVAVVPVGFDPQTDNHPPAPLSSVFTITYTGTIYPGKQDPEKILAAACRLIQRGVIDPALIEIRFFGPRQRWLDAIIDRLGLAGVARQYGMVPREASLQSQRESQLLLLLNWEGEGDVLPLKLFEYFAARRPLLATGGVLDDELARLLVQTRAGVHAVTSSAIEDALRSAYAEYRAFGKIAYKGDAEAVSKYTYREAAQVFAQLLTDVTQ